MFAVVRRCIPIAWFAAGLAPAAALAADSASVTLCPGQIAYPGDDGRVFGHIPYDEAAPADLVVAPAGFGIGCRIERDVLPDLIRLLAAASAAPGVGNRLHAVSCFRSDAHQRAVFCSQIGPRKRCKDAAERARAVAPPGYSEHATGYAIDFVVRPAAGCADVDPCIADTDAGRWLIAHAPEYGFELSFPPGNAQGVTWEPWHWRWVGTGIDEPGAARARLTVARARALYPASPAVSEPPTVPTAPSILPASLPDPLQPL